MLGTHLDADKHVTLFHCKRFPASYLIKYHFCFLPVCPPKVHQICHQDTVAVSRAHQICSQARSERSSYRLSLAFVHSPQPSMASSCTLR